MAIASTGNYTGTTGAGAGLSINLTLPSSVTSGNTIIVGAVIGQSSATATISKASGTATIGTVVTDTAVASSVVDAYGGTTKMVICRVPVTGSGSLVLTVASSLTAYITAGCEEYSGFDASPVYGTPTSNTGSSTSPTTGSVTVPTNGLYFTVAIEAAASNVTRSGVSDFTVYSEADAANYWPILVQRELTTTSSATISETVSPTASWQYVGVVYQTSSGGGGTTYTASISEPASSTDTTSALWMRLSPLPGMYATTPSISITTDAAYQIIYTTDGTDPDITGWLLDDSYTIITDDSGQPVIMDGA